VSSAEVTTVSNVVDCSASADPRVVAPSIGEGLDGSAVMTKKCSQPSVSWKPA